MGYIRIELPIIIDDGYFYPYLLNTKSEKFIDTPEIGISKELFTTSIETLQAAVNKNRFEKYRTST